MIVNMASATYSGRSSNSLGSMKMQFWVKTGGQHSLPPFRYTGRQFESETVVLTRDRISRRVPVLQTANRVTAQLRGRSFHEPERFPLRAMDSPEAWARRWFARSRHVLSGSRK